MNINCKHSSRNPALDIAKGFLIILVVVGHGLQYAIGSDYGTSGEFFFDPFYRAIYCFHMPLFMIISGYLFFRSIHKGMKYVVKSKIVTIVIPYTTYVTIFILLTTLLENTNGWYRILVNEFWFLPSILLNSIIVGLVVHLIKSKTLQLIILTFIAISLHFISKYLPGTYVFMFTCFITGYFYNMFINHSLLLHVNTNHWTLLFAIVSFYICYSYFEYDIFVYTSSTCIWKNGQLSPHNILINIQRYIIGIIASASFMVIVSYYKLLPQKVIKFLGQCSRYSLGIYCLSNILYFLYQMTFDFFNCVISYNYLIPLLLATFILFVTYLFFKYCENTQWLFLLFMGDRRKK